MNTDFERKYIEARKAVVAEEFAALNPMQLLAAVERYLPQLAPSFCRCRRVELYDENGNVFR